jgi:hypothetical protein
MEGHYVPIVLVEFDGTGEGRRSYLDFGQSLEVRIDGVRLIFDCARRSIDGEPPYINYTVAEIRVHRASKHPEL